MWRKRGNLLETVLFILQIVNEPKFALYIPTLPISHCLFLQPSFQMIERFFNVIYKQNHIPKEYVTLKSYLNVCLGYPLTFLTQYERITECQVSSLVLLIL